MNDNYEEYGLLPANLQQQISAVHICGYLNENNTGDEDGNPPTNHWAAFLELAGRKSVRLDMSPGYGEDGQREKIVISSKSYAYTNNDIKTVAFLPKSAATVQQIMEKINQKERDKYHYARVGGL